MADIGALITAAALALTGLGWAAYFTVGAAVVGAPLLIEQRRAKRPPEPVPVTTYRDERNR